MNLRFGALAKPHKILALFILLIRLGEIFIIRIDSTSKDVRPRARV